jgi:hypothetical protein
MFGGGWCTSRRSFAHALICCGDVEDCGAIDVQQADDGRDLVCDVAC